MSDAGGVGAQSALGNDGRAVVAWQRVGASGNIAQGRSRAPDGSWSGIDTLTPGLSTTPGVGLDLSTDGRGHFGLLSLSNSAPGQVLFSGFDGAPPAVSAIAVSGTPTAGSGLAFSVTAGDLSGRPLRAPPGSMATAVRAPACRRRMRT